MSEHRLCIRADMDKTDDYSGFGISLTPAALDQCAQYAERHKDAHPQFQAYCPPHEWRGMRHPDYRDAEAEAIAHRDGQALDLLELIAQEAS